MTSRSGVPSSTSATPARATPPVTVATTVPGDSSVPSVRNQSFPRAMILGTLANVSTLSTRVGGTGSPGPAPAISTWAGRPLSLPRSALDSTTSSTPRRNGGGGRGDGGGAPRPPPPPPPPPPRENPRAPPDDAP